MRDDLCGCRTNSGRSTTSRSRSSSTTNASGSGRAVVFIEAKSGDAGTLRYHRSAAVALNPKPRQTLNP